MTLYAYRIKTIMRFLFSKVKHFSVKCEYISPNKKAHISYGLLCISIKLIVLLGTASSVCVLEARRSRRSVVQVFGILGEYCHQYRVRIPNLLS